jgi:polysaccharide export outer membrane protein
MATSLLLAAAPAMQAAQPLPVRAPSANALQRSRVVRDAYILGPGDRLQVERLDIQEFCGTFSIVPDGTMVLPRLRALCVEGLTVEELHYVLTQQFKAYGKTPQLYVRPVGYRPIRIDVGGEVMISSSSN